MTREEFLAELDELVELPQGTLKGPEKLKELIEWNSLALLGFVGLVDSHNGLKLEPRQIASCITVDDLLNLAKV